MNYETIQTELDAAVTAVTVVPAINQENTVTKVVSGKPFARTTLLPARPNQISVGVTGRDELMGLFQVDLYFPIGSGALEAAAIADAVIAAVPRGWSTSAGGLTLRVTQSWRESGRVIEQLYTVPVMLAWSCIR